MSPNRPLVRLSVLLSIVASGVACLLMADVARGATIKVSPGANLNSVYQSARPGDEIVLAPGGYGSQSIAKDGGKPAGSRPVVFRMRGARFSSVESRANDVEYVGPTVDGNFTFYAGRNVVLRGARAQKPYILGPTSSGPSGDTIDNILIAGGDFGPHSSCGAGFQINTIADGHQGNRPTRNVRIVRNSFRDFSLPSSCPTGHLDCVHAFGGIDGLQIVGNRFVRCENFGALVNGASNVVIENNFMEGGIFGLALRGDADPSVEVFNNVTIRNNSADYISVGSPGANTLNNVVVEGNATIDGVNCRRGVRYARNLTQRGDRCRGDLRPVSSIRFADPAAGDFHIPPSSPAVDRLVTGPSTDFDGDSRPQGPKRDIGADEVEQLGRPGGGSDDKRRQRSALLRSILEHVERWLRLSSRGFVRLELRCRRASAARGPRRCKGTVSLRRARAGLRRAGAADTRRARGTLLGRKRFAIRTGRVVPVKVRLRRPARAVLRRHRIKARVRVTVRSRGVKAAASKRVILRRRR
jgi:hypothetical protein